MDAAWDQNDAPLRQVNHRYRKPWTNPRLSRITRLAVSLAMRVAVRL
jgi:hypothetical protein